MESLKRKKDFKDLVAAGRKLRPAPWLIVNYGANNLGHIRWGWTAGGRIGTAVMRNRLKRWCREFLKLKRDVGVDINIVFLKPRNPAFYKELKHEDLDRCLEKAWKSIQRDS